MNCNKYKCQSNNTRVTCTRKTFNQTKRYCRCLDCGNRYITIELYDVPLKEVKVHPRQSKRGEENNRAVMTEKDIKAIRKLAKDQTYQVIANQYGIHKDTVYKIVNFKLWSHVKKEEDHPVPAW